MRIRAKIAPFTYYTALHELIRLTFPEHEIIFQESIEEKADLIIQADFTEQNNKIFFTGRIGDFIRTDSGLLSDRKEEKNRELRRILFRFLSDYKGSSISEYGILTGVRPVKIVHRMLDAGLKEPEIIDQLQTEYFIAEQTAARLWQVAANNRFAFTPKVPAKQIGIYVGIPFCVSKCYYCSFPGAILKKYAGEIPAFLSALRQEITEIGDYLKEHGYKVDMLYIGGGTPSILESEDLIQLFFWLDKSIPWAAKRELTFEAGRPDSLTPEKIKLIQDWGADRICINPQSMHDYTLNAIGRRHTAEDIKRTVELVRAAGKMIVNMDLILGLPGETSKQYQSTIEQVLALNPENITLHSLAVKKGSLLKEREGILGASGEAREIREAARAIEHTLTAQGYIPYYMYRQKYIKDNLDNIGYALPGTECIYNIRMMEEKQTIVGIGGGASSKLIDPANAMITAYHNPKDPWAYQTNIARHIKAKLDKL